MNYYEDAIEERTRRNKSQISPGTYRQNYMLSQEQGCQSHVHEFLGSTKLAEEEEDRHSHRVAGVTSQAIPVSGGNHVHALLTNTDFFENHHHELGAVTEPGIYLSNSKHIHVVNAITTLDDGHFHLVTFATLIDDPIS